MGTLVNGIKEIFATSQTTATHLPVCASDGTPQGRISVGDLASVLGGIMLNTNYADYNFNNLTTFGNYAINNTENWDNKPSGANGSGFIICGGWVFNNNRRTLQVLYLQNNTAYFRAYDPVGSTWQPWQQFSFDVPSFYKNYDSIGNLATATGIQHFDNIEAGDSITFNKLGIIFVNISSGGDSMIILNMFGNYTFLKQKEKSIYQITITKGQQTSITLSPDNYNIGGIFMPYSL